MNRFKRKRNRWLLIVSALFSLLGIVAFLTLTGWLVDPSVALRELERRGIAPTKESVFAAAQSGDAELLRTLVRAGAPTSQQNATGDAPLHIAARAKQWVALNVLVEHAPELDAPNARGQVALELAFQHGGHEAAERMLAKGASSQASFSGTPPLIALIKANDGEGIRILLKHHADPNIASGRGETPLFLAAQSGNIELILALIEAGADPNATTPGGRPIVSFLIERTNEGGLSEAQTVDALGLFIAKGVDLERPDSEGWRPIHHALAARLPLVTAALLPLVKNVAGTLWIALKNQDFAGVQTLLEMGASVDERNENGDTALIGMIRQNQPQIVKLLLDFGGDPTQLAPEGQAAIPLSIVMGHDEVSIALINHKNAPPPDSYLITPATLEFRKLFKNALLDFYVRKESITQLTPLMAATCLDQKEVVLALLDRGANRYASTAPTNVFPIQFAAKRENVQMQQILIGVPWQDDQQERQFVINLATQKVTLLQNGNAIKTSGISSGRSTHPTIPGKYVITDKARMHHSNLYGGAKMPFFQRFSCTAMGFHEGVLPGYAASHGCVRLPKSTAEFFFKESKIGDRVDIVKN